MRAWRWNGWMAAGLIMAALPASADVTVSHGISTFGDLKYPADFPHLDYVNPKAPKGGEISVWAPGGFDSFNPYSVKGRAAALSSVFYESLLTNVADETGAAYCLVCESLEYPEGREWVIFNLREAAKFSDGSPLTAADVEFSYKLFLEKGLTDYRTVLAQQVEGVEVLSPQKIKFTFRAGFPTRDLPQEVGGLPILSKAHYEANNSDLEEASSTPFLGSGQYTLDKFTMGQMVSYKRNPDFWGNDLPINIGRGNFDRLRVEYYADYNAAFEGFKAGSYTFRDEASALTWATGYDFPAVQNGYVKKVELPSGSKASGQAFLFNLRREKFADPKVREAIGLMFNFEWSNATLFYGIYVRVKSIWENSDLAASGVPSEGELAILQPLVDEGLLPASILTDPAVDPPVSGERQLDRGNLRKANALLDEAGWAMGQDGLRRNAKGETLKVEFINESQTFDRILIPYVDNLRRAGIDAVLTRIDDAQMTLRERPPAFDFDIVTGNASSTLIPGPELKQFYGSATADMSSFNLMGLKSPAVDRLIDQVIAATSREEMVTRTHALDRVLRAERFWVPQYYKNQHTVAYYDQFSHPETLPPFTRGELDFWWYDADKAAKLRSAGVLR